MTIPSDPDTLLTRDRLAAVLTEAGFPVSPKTLATRATRGGGPPFQKFGPRALYRWGTGLAWAQGRLTAPRRSTSEADAHIAQSSRVVSPVGVGLETPRPAARASARRIPVKERSVGGEQ
jgi:hypothetical protein